MKANPFTTDVFTVPFKDGYILYIPEFGLVAGVDKRVQQFIHNISQGLPFTDSPFTREWIEALTALGAFAPKSPQERELGEFLPTDVTLSLTSRCNLRCIYCYARGGERIADMREELLSDALQFVIQNSLRKEETKIGVSFHGEGEPTANWPLFRKALLLSLEEAEKNGLEVTFSMSSNGMWTRSQRAFIAEHFQNPSISFDGLPELQNQQRPTLSGKPSFPKVFENLKFLDAEGVGYGLRATVLPEGIDSLLPFVEMVAEELACRWMHLEPVFYTGRALDLGFDTEKARDFFHRFSKTFHQTVIRGRELGIHIEYSGCRAGLHSTHFCHATGADPNFFISTNGTLSSCYEIIDPSSPKGRFTVYGQYDPVERTFCFDQEKLQQIRSFDMQQIPQCQDCFVRWNCSGDCFARSDISMDKDGELQFSKASLRCLLNRETTLHELIHRAVDMDVQSRV